MKRLPRCRALPRNRQDLHAFSLFCQGQLRVHSIWAATAAMTGSHAVLQASQRRAPLRHPKSGCHKPSTILVRNAALTAQTALRPRDRAAAIGTPQRFPPHRSIAHGAKSGMNSQKGKLHPFTWTQMLPRAKPALRRTPPKRLGIIQRQHSWCRSAKARQHFHCHGCGRLGSPEPCQAATITGARGSRRRCRRCKCWTKQQSAKVAPALTQPLLAKGAVPRLLDSLRVHLGHLATLPVKGTPGSNILHRHKYPVGHSWQTRKD
mmetsp:Transcript_47876/g.92560  ORF Transcript_47876/g.92560 Transcript_47876/m.92560 type:complete len:263 (-) Transcript_47876:324-1112(-)